MVNEKTVQVKNRQIPYKMEESIKKEGSEMPKMNIIEPSESPFCSPVVIDPKKDGTHRFCVDYTKSLTVRQCFTQNQCHTLTRCFRNLLSISSFFKLICRRVIGKLR